MKSLCRISYDILRCEATGIRAIGPALPICLKTRQNKMKFKNSGVASAMIQWGSEAARGCACRSASQLGPLTLNKELWRWIHLPTEILLLYVHYVSKSDDYTTYERRANKQTTCQQNKTKFIKMKDDDVDDDDLHTVMMMTMTMIICWRYSILRFNSVEREREREREIMKKKS